MGLPIDRSLCISILLSSLMPFQCQQTESSKIRRGVGSLCCSLSGTAGLGFAGGNHPTTEMGPLTSCLTQGLAGESQQICWGGWRCYHTPTSPSLCPTPAQPSPAELEEQSCAGTMSSPGETQQLHGEGGREGVFSPRFHRGEPLIPCAAGAGQGENRAIAAVKALADLTC